MLFCLTADYTPQALNAMRENPSTDRRAAVEQLIAAAGGKLIAMYGRAANGPGAMVIFDVPDPAMAPAMVGVAVSAGSVQNVELTRLFTMEEIADIGKRRGRSAAPTSRLVSSSQNPGAAEPAAPKFREDPAPSQPASPCRRQRCTCRRELSRTREPAENQAAAGFGHGSEPPDIRAYAALHQQFPHESTADQWFSESQMESYRGLDSHIIGKLCGSLETARTALGGRLDIEALAHSVTCYLESTRPQPPVVSDAADPRRPQVTTLKRAKSNGSKLRSTISIEAEGAGTAWTTATRLDLPVGYRDQVGWDIGGEIAGIGLGDIGNAVNEPPPSSADSFAERSSRREWR